MFLEILVGFPIHLDTTAEEEQSGAQAGIPTNTGAEQVMQGVHFVESRSGNRDWEMFAEAAEGYQSKGTWELKKVKVLFYSDDVVQFTVTGKTGNIDAKSKDIDIAGSVETKSSNGYLFQTEQLRYQARLRLLTSKDKVHMLGPPDSKGNFINLNGQDMETQVDKKIMSIKQNVVATMTLGDDKKKASVTSGGAEFSGLSFSAKFYDHVAVELDTMKLEGPEAFFQYDQGKDFLQSILLQGGVRATDTDKYATSDTIKFEPLENKFILNGRPRVVQNNDEIQGDQIIFIDGGKKVKVENIRARMDKQ